VIFCFIFKNPASKVVAKQVNFDRPKINIFFAQ